VSTSLPGVVGATRAGRDMPRTADLVIVGAGVIGCATAFFAARAGLRAVVIERRPALATLTTPASTGAFRLQFDNPEEIELVREGVAFFDEFEARTGLPGWDIGIRHGGYLFCSLTDAAAERARRLVERQREWGLADVELLTGDEARRRWPYLSPEVRAARFRASDGWLDPKRLAIGYAEAARQPERIPGAQPGGGATFVTGVEVTSLLLSAGGSALRGVATSAGEIHAETVIVASGPFLAVLPAAVGVAVEIRPTVRQKLVVPKLAFIPPDAPMTIEEETAAHWRPALEGCLALWTDAHAPPTPPADPVPTDAGWVWGLLDPASDHALARVSRFWADAWNDGAPAFSWYLQAGQYEYTPDRRPYLGPTDVDGLYLNGGYSGHGVMAGTGGSRLVIDLLTGREPADENPFRVDRPMASCEHDIL
jgi:sarcosine oxidase subunit beta